MYETVTRDIRVAVEPHFLADQSQPDQNRYLWAYRVTIRNDGGRTVQLRSRYWRITDGAGRVQEVRGDGVVGKQPMLAPGESFQYTSGTPLPTPSGFMTGTYQMQTGEGEEFDIDIPTFSLDSPHQSAIVH
ncbi:MAG: Co2+/Mg2+ efflux protein ApaG [Alphaproteobacteria bacterium]|nr:Co2+/Mg2+ efflux protein ApaG [Alphaproteobacteria bacterium]